VDVLQSQIYIQEILNENNLFNDQRDTDILIVKTILLYLYSNLTIQMLEDVTVIPL
jgi:hypothetical protein